MLPIASAWSDGVGLSTDADRVPWAHLQGRIVYATAAPIWRSDLAPAERSGLNVNSLSLLGDVYFGAAPAKDSIGGFRATSGVIVGARSSLWGAPAAASAGGLLAVDRRLFGPNAPALVSLTDPGTDSNTVPYVGVGYSSLSAKSGWSFSADLGLVSLSPGNASRLGRVFGGGQSLDDVVHDMRIAPVVQFGVSYSF
jgi:hypothetical protein